MSYVYFAQVGRYIKVGYSENPERRVANLFKSATRYGAPRDIDSRTPRTLLAAVDGTKDDESVAHMALDDFRVFGEWFLDEPELRGYVAACLALGEVIPSVIDRPAGDYWWGADPILYSAADRAEDERAAAAMTVIFADLRPAASP